MKIQSWQNPILVHALWLHSGPLCAMASAFEPGTLLLRFPNLINYTPYAIISLAVAQEQYSKYMYIFLLCNVSIFGFDNHNSPNRCHSLANSSSEFFWRWRWLMCTYMIPKTSNQNQSDEFFTNIDWRGTKM